MYAYAIFDVSKAYLGLCWQLVEMFLAEWSDKSCSSGGIFFWLLCKSILSGLLLVLGNISFWIQGHGSTGLSQCSCCGMLLALATRQRRRRKLQNFSYLWPVFASCTNVKSAGSKVANNYSKTYPCRHICKADTCITWAVYSRAKRSIFTFKPPVYLITVGHQHFE